jgi:GTP-binding protein
MVDLPGYGYAKISQSERKKWGSLINSFFSASKNIQLTIHIVDSRHQPTELDFKLNDMLRSLNIPYIVLMNKSDKLKQSEYSLAKKKITKVFPELILNENLFYFSSVKGTGSKEIKKLLTALFY